MSDLSAFLKENRCDCEHVFVPVCADFKDSDGKLVLWEIRAVSTAEDGEIRDSCTLFDESGAPRLNMNLYTAKFAAASVVFPDLLSADLQDSYGVFTPHELLVSIARKPGEYQNLVRHAFDLSGFAVSDSDMDVLVEKAKKC